MLGPRWLLAHLVVLSVAVLFVRLGFWQLDRLEERRILNAVGESSFEKEPLEFWSLLEAAGDDIDTLRYRRASASGMFDPANELLIRSQVHLGIAGFHVVTPLVGESGEAVLVNRGWVPLGLDQVPVADALPPADPVTIEGWVNLTQERRALGPRDPAEGRLVTLSRVDVERIQQQLPYPVAPVYLVALGEGATNLPVPAERPVFNDEGPHLAYAIQWFSFAAIGLIGYFFLVRSRVQRPRGDVS